MAFDKTITEYDLDGSTEKLVAGLEARNEDFEPDLAVDGLTDSLLSRVLGLFRPGR